MQTPAHIQENRPTLNLLHTFTFLFLLFLLPLHLSLHHRFNHLTPNLHPLLKPTLQKRSSLHKPPLIHLKITKTNSLTPPPGSNNEFEVVRPMPSIVQRRMERSAKEGGVEEEVLGYAEEETEEGGCGEGEVGVWIDFEVGPGVDHGEEGEVGVGSVAGWNAGGRSAGRFGIGRGRWGGFFRRLAGFVGGE